jgi:hypothetical protein
MPISQKCHDTYGQDSAISQHSWDTQIGLASIPQRQKLAPIFLFSKKFERPQWLCTKDYKSYRGCSAWPNGQTQIERLIGGDCAWILQKTFSFIGVFLSYTSAKEQWRKVQPSLLPYDIRRATSNRRMDMRHQQV